MFLKRQKIDFYLLSISLSLVTGVLPGLSQELSPPMVDYGSVSKNSIQNQSAPYKWHYWHSLQGTYKAVNNRRIRFLNIEYIGPNSLQLWERCFVEAAHHYRREDVTYKVGHANDFFEVGNLSNSVKRIVGWIDDSNGEHGYAVLTRIVGDTVYYTTNDGKSYIVHNNPNNFANWKIGFTPGDWDSGKITYVSIQIWKHLGNGSPNAGVSLRFRDL